MCLPENPMCYSYNQVGAVEPLIMQFAGTGLVLYVKQLEGVIK